MPILTLLTDFGTRDEYAGVMKGVILSIDPTAVIVDISHRIDPQDVIQAAYMIEAAYPFFPPATVHLVVVDPGVGGDRGILAVAAAGQIFIAPDNGVLTAVLDHLSPDAVVRVENPRYFLPSVSRTFHGRDIFAPVAAHVARGVELGALGPPLDGARPVRLPLPRPVSTGKGVLTGTVVAADSFGNLLTCIASADIEAFCGSSQQEKLAIRIGENEIRGVSSHYGSVPPNHPLALIGSRGLLEIGVNCGSAAATFKARKGDVVTLLRTDRAGGD